MMHKQFILQVIHTCMLQNPQLYGVSVDEAEADPLLKQRRADLMQLPHYWARTASSNMTGRVEHSR